MKNNLEDQYWKQIKKLKWEEDHDYKRIEQYLKDNFTVSEAIRLNDFVSEKVNQLYTKYESDWLAEPGISVSDDGWSDLLNEVVGRGKEFYENIDVECLQDMADHNDYEESFSYCFHFTYDLQRQEAQTPPPLQYLLISQDQGDKTQIKKEWFKDKSTAEEKRKQLRANYFDVIIVSEEQAVAIKDGEQIVLHIVNR
jgi:protein required for attachment to host cells